MSQEKPKQLVCLHPWLPVSQATSLHIAVQSNLEHFVHAAYWLSSSKSCRLLARSASALLLHCLLSQCTEIGFRACSRVSLHRSLLLISPQVDMLNDGWQAAIFFWGGAKWPAHSNSSQRASAWHAYIHSTTHNLCARSPHRQ